jgi:hypothetical protein
LAAVVTVFAFVVRVSAAIVIIVQELALEPALRPAGSNTPNGACRQDSHDRDATGAPREINPSFTLTPETATR